MKKWLIIILCSLSFISCTPKYTFKVEVFYVVPGEKHHRIDTIEVETTRSYPKLILRDGDVNMRLIEPNPWTPWKNRERLIYVGPGQDGFMVLGRKP